ncbi:hypothetical protein FACS1894140_2700 [Spirochaetia bacterium]|nr:hypothetical protein FACS1894140_2700 [Spirochaetia bacterium]
MKKVLAVPVLIAFCLAASCATSPASDSVAVASDAQASPLWVSDRNAAFPDRLWLCVVENARDKDTAQASALNALAQVFKTDVAGVTTAINEYTNAVASSGKKKIATFVESKDFAQEVTASTSVAGLVGVETDVWTAKDGTVYANARMNRRECAARYSAMIRENEGIIRRLKEDAAQNNGTFDAFESLKFAATVAEVSDHFQSLLEVLDLSAIDRRPDYGNANAVKALAQNAARSIVITVRVTGDSGDRITKAFTAFLEGKGFRTSAAGANAYQLSTAVELENVVLANQANKFVRYVLTTSIVYKDGTEVFSWSGNGREGHATEPEARQRALRAAEAAVGTGAFAKDFNEYLDSLLK